MSSSEYDEIARGLDEARAELERARLDDEVPNKKRQSERAEALRKVSDAAALVRDLERRRGDETHIAGALAQMNKSTKDLLAAINANTATTNALLTTADARLALIEQSVLDGGGDSLFPADPRVIAEGEFLRAQLGGVQGTEDPRPLFKDATPQPVVGGLDLITATVCAECNDDDSTQVE